MKNVPLIGFSSGSGANQLYPVGSLYWSTVDTSPASLFGGTWERIKDRFILAAGDTYEAGSTGGNAEITQTVEQMPSHSHNVYRMQNKASSGNSLSAISQSTASGSSELTDSVSYAGGGEPMNIMNPYLAAYCWKRIA